MASNSEVGHAKNIANLQDLISFCQGYGAIYNPTKSSLSITALQTLYQTSLANLNTTKDQKINFDKATNERKNSFAQLRPLATRVINAFAVSGVDSFAIANAKTVNKKLQGSTKKKTNIIDPESSTSSGISTSQQSYDRLIDHFASLIQVLQQNGLYNPNENDLKTSNLQSKLTELQTKNSNLINAYTQYSNAMIQRNQVLYNPMNGLVQTTKEVKQYVKSIFGAKSPQFKQISSLEFKVIKSE